MNMTPEYLTSVSCNELKVLPEETKHQISKIVAEYYHAKGFPYFDLDSEKRNKVFLQLKNFDVKRLELPDNVLQQNMLGLNLANYYHPQMWSTRYKNNRTPMEVFQNTELFTKAIYKRINLSDTKLQPFSIRKALKTFGAYGVSNFRPTIAKYIYEKYCHENGFVLDPCAGYGGRLLGSLVSKTVSRYIGIDPDIRQVYGNVSMTKDFCSEQKAKICCLPFEDFETDDKFDLVFTSPPYFNIEKYSDEHTQSWIRYPTYEGWKEKFLFVLIEKSFDLLMKDGYFVINVAGSDIIKDTMEHSKKVFGEVVDIKHMRLSSGFGRGRGGSFKLEDIYIFRK